MEGWIGGREEGVSVSVDGASGGFMVYGDETRWYAERALAPRAGR